jgi:exodeoxyribonuclease V alpha subunit
MLKFWKGYTPMGDTAELFDDLDAHDTFAAAPLPNEVSISGTVEKLFFSSPGFSAGVLRDNQGIQVKFAGKLSIQEGDEVTITGSWKDSKYGKQIEVRELRFNMRLTTDGIERWLANNKAFAGIGPVKARAIAEAFGNDFERVLLQDPQRIATIAKVSVETVTLMATEWQRNAAFNAVGAQLSHYELTPHQITTLYQKYGAGILSILKTDPFVIVREVDGYGFKRLDRIARKVGVPKDHTGRVRAGVWWVMQEVVENGSTCIEWDALVKETVNLLSLDSEDAGDTVNQAIQSLMDEGKLSTVHEEWDLLVTLSRLLDAEEYLSVCLMGAGEANPHYHPDMEQLLPPQLNQGQREAALICLRSRITVLTGGAGTGKTFTTRGIAQTYERMGLAVAFAAPTGKAAKRLEEVGCEDAKTIHRLLHYDARLGEFYYNAENTLPYDVIIIDEFSMVDTLLAYHLFQSINWKRTALIMVGDHHQLPPVGPGYPFRDIVRYELAPVAKLTVVERHAGVLCANSVALLTGSVLATAKDDVSAWHVVHHLKEPSELTEFILSFLRDVAGPRLGLDPVRDVQVLAPQKKGPIGVNALNATIQAWVQTNLLGNAVEPADPIKKLPIYPGDKVIQTKNDYTLGVMNGTLGYVLEVNHADKFMRIAFDDGQTPYEATIALDKPHYVRPAYALTIHKSQGSEWPCVLAVIHKSHAFMHARNLLYTAVTRARRVSVILGDGWGIRNCAHQTDQAERRTLLPVITQNMKQLEEQQAS